MILEDLVELCLYNQNTERHREMPMKWIYLMEKCGGSKSGDFEPRKDLVELCLYNQNKGRHREMPMESVYLMGIVGLKVGRLCAAANGIKILLMI